MNNVGKVALCACGECDRPATKGKWWPGHWNKGKRHENRASPAKDSDETRQKKSESAKLRWKRENREIIFKPCACGCGEMVKGTWAQGHHSRVNNVSKRDDVKEKRSENFKKLHIEGRLPNWNRGLTKETDERVAANIEQMIRKSKTEESREMHSRLMKDQWKSGSIVPLTGPDHPAWKGGTSTISQRLRGSHQLYIRWKLPVLQRDGFRCKRCEAGSEDRLVVHHDQERFATILRKCLVQLFPDCDLREITFDEQTEVMASVIEYHVNQSVSGITLCHDCHSLVHQEEQSEDLD